MGFIDLAMEGGGGVSRVVSGVRLYTRVFIANRLGASLLFNSQQSGRPGQGVKCAIYQQ